MSERDQLIRNLEEWRAELNSEADRKRQKTDASEEEILTLRDRAILLGDVLIWMRHPQRF